MGDRSNPDWAALLAALEEKTAFAEAMGGTERLARQKARGRLNVRERISRLCDPGSFREFGALAGAHPPDGSAPIPADGLVGGTALIGGRPVVLMAEDFTVMGGSIGHVNAAKRLRLATLARDQRLPFVTLLDGVGERGTNALTRYPYGPNDLQIIADLKGQVPMVSLVLGSSAGHGALAGAFADFIVMTKDAALFTAGPPLVKAALGLDVTAEVLGGSAVHEKSGVVHAVAQTEEEAFTLARKFLGLMPRHRGETAPLNGGDRDERVIDDMLDIVPARLNQPYDVRLVIERIADAGSLVELSPVFGASMVTAFGRLGGHAVLYLANQPNVLGGAITREAAEKACHALGVAAAFGHPVIFLADNPGVMPGPDAEKAGTIRYAAQLYSAQRQLRGPKLHAALRKMFGFGSTLMASNGLDRQSVVLAFPGLSLGGVPASSGADAAKMSSEERAQLLARQSGAWPAADNGTFDRIIDPRNLRNELLCSLRRIL